MYDLVKSPTYLEDSGIWHQNIADAVMIVQVKIRMFVMYQPNLDAFGVLRYFYKNVSGNFDSDFYL